MAKLSQTLISGVLILVVAILAAFVMQLVTPGGGFIGVALWAVFFVTLLYFPPRECVAKFQRLWKRN